MNLESTLSKDGLNWTVSKRPGFYQDEDGEFVPTGKFQTVRDDIGYSFGEVSGGYELIQNLEGLQFLVDLADSDGIEITNALMFGNGREIAIVTEVPEHVTIGVDEAVKYLNWTCRHDGRGAGLGFGTDIFVVCKNTLQLAKSTSKYRYSIRHTKSKNMRLEDAREAIKLSFKQTADYNRLAKDLLAHKFESANAYQSFMRKLVNLEGKGAVKESKNPRAHRNAVDTMQNIHTIRRTAEYISDYRNTYWGAVQAVTDHVSNHVNYRKPTSRFTKLAVNGHPLTQKAIDLLTA